MKVIFLDIDGVMDDLQFLQENGASGPDEAENNPEAPNFSPRCVEKLNRIIAATGAKIVLSSSWRRYYVLRFYEGKYKDPLDGIKRLFEKNGVIGEVVGRTGIFDEGLSLEAQRPVEITKWLAYHPEVTSWVAIDDMSLPFKHYVKTRYPYCLDGLAAAQAIVFLSEEV